MMKSLTRSIAMIGLLGSSFAATADWQEIGKELSLDAAELTKLEVSAGVGELLIYGDKQLTEVMVKATIAGEDLDEDDYELYLRQHGQRAYLYAQFDRELNRKGYIDLEVRVPSQLKLRVQDKSGDMLVKGIDADISVTDGSGDLKLTDIAGDVRLKDGSGKAVINTIAGDLDVKDGSGDLKITTVTGSVDIEDGSGDIRIATITGDLEVDDSSGDVEVYTVAGKVVMKDSSGDIMVDTAEGFSLISDGSGEVELRNVKDRSSAE